MAELVMEVWWDWQVHTELELEWHALLCSLKGCVRLGGALSAVRAQCGRSATIWAYSRTGDPYFVILGASLLPLA